ncbi:methyltransferase [Clostridia bacterium]|nr:methyltransferase [Clostridia bacterium]
MNSRERVVAALNHEIPDRVPFDLGSSAVTGIAAGELYLLKKALGLGEEPVYVHEPFQVLGSVDNETLDAVGADIIGVWPKKTFAGFENKNWRDWQLFDRTPVKIPEGFVYDADETGALYLYPQGDRSVKPSMKMPYNGNYFDVLVRQEPVDENNLNGREDFKDDFTVFSEEELRDTETEVNRLYKDTNRALFGANCFLSLGDAALNPGPGMKRTPGIRKHEDWYMAHLLYPNYIKEVFEYQTEIALKNLALYKEAVGDKIAIAYVSGADFGTQKSEFMSADMFREFYAPFYKKVNTWIHNNTTWKTFFHSCGSIVKLLDDFVDIGVDILNPVQCSAVDMDAEFLKEKYGKSFTFWGGAVNTQQTLPFGTPEQVYEEVKTRMRIFSPGGGFVCCSIHNIQNKVPIENLTAYLNAVKDFNSGKI